MPKVVQAKSFDWTFTTTYAGHVSVTPTSHNLEVPPRLFVKINAFAALHNAEPRVTS